MSYVKRKSVPISPKVLTPLRFWCVYGGSAAVAETLYVFLHEDKPTSTGEGHTSHHLRHNMHTKPGHKECHSHLYTISAFLPFLSDSSLTTQHLRLAPFYSSDSRLVVPGGVSPRRAVLPVGAVRPRVGHLLPPPQPPARRADPRTTGGQGEE